MVNPGEEGWGALRLLIFCIIPIPTKDLPPEKSEAILREAFAQQHRGNAEATASRSLRKKVAVQGMADTKNGDQQRWYRI